MLLREGLNCDPADVFSLTREPPHQPERWGEVSRAICWPPSTPAREPATGPAAHCSRHPPGGGTVARVLARRFGSLDTLMAASEEELGTVEGVGRSIVRFAAGLVGRPESRRLVEKLRAAGCAWPTSRRREWNGPARRASRW